MFIFKICVFSKVHCKSLINILSLSVYQRHILSRVLMLQIF